MQMTSWFESLRRRFGSVTWAKTPEATDAAVTKDESGNVVGQPVESAPRKAAREAREAVAAQKAENAKQNAMIAAGLRKSPLGAGGPISDELARAVASRMVGSIRLGVKQFDAFIKDLRAKLDDASVASLKPTLIRTWNAIREKHGLGEATEAGFDAGMTPELERETEQPVAIDEPPAKPPKTLETVPSDSPSKYLPPKPKPRPPSHSLKGDLLLNGSLSLDPETARLNEPETEVERRAHHPAIQRMGFPEWSFLAFQQLRRLVEDIHQQPDPIPSREIPERLDKILAYFPASFVTYDDKCKYRVEELMRDFEKKFLKDFF